MSASNLKVNAIHGTVGAGGQLVLSANVTATLDGISVPPMNITRDATGVTKVNGTALVVDLSAEVASLTSAMSTFATKVQAAINAAQSPAA